MAESITIKALQDASLDAKSLEEVVNGNDAKQVTTRLGESYPSVKKAIKTLFENGGLPATPFTTKALMESSALVDGDYAMVTDDSINSGLYVKTSGAWVKSKYDILATARAAAAVEIGVATSEFIETPTNLFSLNDVTLNKLVNIGGDVVDSAGYNLTKYIKVSEGVYTYRTDLKYASRHIALYDKDKEFIKRMDVGSATTSPEYVDILELPEKTTYVRFVTDKAKSGSNVMFYRGQPDAVDGYFSNHKPILKDTFILSEGTKKTLKSQLIPYDFVENHVVAPRNMINADDFVLKGGIDSSGVVSAPDRYFHTEFISITSGTDYVLQTVGNRYALRFIAWYSESGGFIKRDSASAPSSGDNHAVVTAPVGAYYARLVGDSDYITETPNNVAMYEGSELDTDFAIGDTSVKLVNLKIDNNSTPEVNELPDMLDSIFLRGDNLFNPALATEGFLVSRSGELEENSTYFVSEYIAVKQGVYSILGDRMSSTPFNGVALFTDKGSFYKRLNLTYSDYAEDGSDKLTIEIPKGVKYVRLNGNLGTAYERKRMFIRGIADEDTPYNVGETYLSNVRLAQDVRFDARTPRFRTDTNISGTFHTNIAEHEAERPYTLDLNSAQVYERYDALAALYPDNIETFELGTDALGNRMAYYKVTAPKIDADMNQKLPLVFINCGIHGTERVSATVMYRLIEQMLTDWRSSDVLQSLKFNMDLLVLPVSNPSGWNERSRFNHKGVDINRNFSAGWDTQHDNSGDGAFSELESRAVAKAITDNKGIDIFLDFHNFSGGPINGYYTWLPITSSCYPYMAAAAKSYVSKLTHLVQRDYDYVPESWVAGWVSLSGTAGMSQDYAAEQGILFCSTFELCSYLYPYAEHIDKPYNDVSHDEVHSKMMYEATVTALITFLTELQRY